MGFALAIRERPATWTFGVKIAAAILGPRAYLLPRWRGVSVSTAYSGAALGEVLTTPFPRAYYDVHEADYCVLEVFSRHYGQDVYARK